MECKCLCHEDLAVEDFIPCCFQCPYCGMNIAFEENLKPASEKEKHIEECKIKHGEMKEK